jgi:hypothetical protein
LKIGDGDANGPVLKLQQSTVTIERIRVNAIIDVQDARRLERVKEIGDLHETALTKAVNIKNKSNLEHIEDVKSELNEKHSKAKMYLMVTFQKMIEAVKVKVQTATQVDAVIRASAEMIDVSKLMNKGPMEEWLTYVKRFNQTSSAMGRSGRSKADVVKKTLKKAAPQPPLFMSLMIEMAKEALNCSKSVFEAKGGIRPGLIKVTTNEAFDNVHQAPALKRVLKKIASAIKSGKTACVEPIDLGKAGMKKFEESLDIAVGPDLRTKCPLPKAAWTPQVFTPEVVGCRSSHADVFWPKFGMMSVNMVLSGDASYLGVPTLKVPGSSYLEKRAHLLSCNAEQLTVLAEDGGWFCRFCDGVALGGESVLVIPSGFVVVFALQDARVLRWPIVGDQVDLQRISDALGNLIVSFPELVDESCYRELAEHLGGRPS